MDDLSLLMKLMTEHGPFVAVAAIFIWLFLQERKRCEALTNRLADTGDKLTTALEKTAAANEGLREVVRAATPR